MTETPAQPAQPAQHAQQPATTRPAKRQPTWRANDLAGYAVRWGTSAAVIRAALKSSGKDGVSSPDEAEKLVKAFREQDLAELEKDAREARAKERAGGKR